MGERLGTISHSYVYVFKIGNVGMQAELLFIHMFATISSSEPDAQHTKSGYMIDLKLFLISDIIFDGKILVKESSHTRAQHLTE